MPATASAAASCRQPNSAPRMSCFLVESSSPNLSSMSSSKWSKPSADGLIGGFVSSRDEAIVTISCHRSRRPEALSFWYTAPSGMTGRWRSIGALDQGLRTRRPVNLRSCDTVLVELANLQMEPAPPLTPTLSHQPSAISHHLDPPFAAYALA